MYILHFALGILKDTTIILQINVPHGHITSVYNYWPKLIRFASTRRGNLFRKLINIIVAIRITAAAAFQSRSGLMLRT